MPSFLCRLDQTATAFPHFWETAVGSGHAPLALRADWQHQLRRCRTELGFRHVRFHGLLSDDVGTLIRHREQPLYSFFNADTIMDFLVSIGMRPFVELSFMPTMLSSGETTVFKYRGNVTPPRDYGEWAELVRRLASHWVERYGAAEVRRWPFEVWNEPNLKAFWTGTQAQYFTLYRHTAAALKRIDPLLQVGGPATAMNAWIEEFLDFCGRSGIPADFVTTHHYPTDAMGEEGDDTETQLAKSRRGILAEQAREARRRAGSRILYYTEWSSSSNPRDPLHDEPYTAAFVVKTVMEASGLVDGYSFWTFSDIFEENYFPSLPFHGGFGLLTLHGVPKPAYRAFELMHRLGEERLAVEGVHETVDAWAVRKDTELTVLLSNHALPGHPVRTERVEVLLTGGFPLEAARLERIDENHANPRRQWSVWGSPEYPSQTQVDQLEDASRLAPEPWPAIHTDGITRLEVDLPPHGVAAITLRLGNQRDNGGGTLRGG